MVTPIDCRAWISIHASREGSDGRRKSVMYDPFISIHASREGSDHRCAERGREEIRISIHASREGSDRGGRHDREHRPDFNPRFPRGKRLCAICGKPLDSANFNPRFPRGKRRAVNCEFTASRSISIHASREGSDLGVCQQTFYTWKFQSTLPAREATHSRAKRPA